MQLRLAYLRVHINLKANESGIVMPWKPKKQKKQKKQRKEKDKPTIIGQKEEGSIGGVIQEIVRTLFQKFVLPAVYLEFAIESLELCVLDNDDVLFLSEQKEWSLRVSGFGAGPHGLPRVGVFMGSEGSSTPFTDGDLQAGLHLPAFRFSVTAPLVKEDPRGVQIEVETTGTGELHVSHDNLLSLAYFARDASRTLSEPQKDEPAAETVETSPAEGLSQSVADSRQPPSNEGTKFPVESVNVNIGPIKLVWNGSSVLSDEDALRLEYRVEKFALDLAKVQPPEEEGDDDEANNNKPAPLNFITPTVSFVRSIGLSVVYTSNPAHSDITQIYYQLLSLL